jgi:hypothetical protein
LPGNHGPWNFLSRHSRSLPSGKFFFVQLIKASYIARSLVLFGFFFFLKSPFFIGCSINPSGSQHYRLCQDFIRDLEKRCCQTPTTLRSLKTNEAMVDFNKRWTIEVYVKLRAQEFFEALRPMFAKQLTPNPRYKSPQSGGGSNGPFDDSCFEMLSTSLVVRVISDIFSERVLIPTVGHRFVRIAVQVLSGYNRWVENVTQASQVSSTGTTQPTNASSATGSGASGTSTASSLSAQDTAKAIGSTLGLKELIQIFSDTVMLSEVVSSEAWSSSIDKAIGIGAPREGSETTLSVRNLFQLSSQGLRARVDATSKVLIARVVKECTERPLLAVKTISAQYQMTGRTMPTQPSLYVAQVSLPLSKDFYCLWHLNTVAYLMFVCSCLALLSWS